MDDHALRKQIAQIVSDSSRMMFTRHARQRMRQRHVTPMQVLEVLRRGRIVESAHRNQHGNWQCTLQHRTGGDEIKVAAAVSVDHMDGKWVVVITVMN